MLLAVAFRIQEVARYGQASRIEIVARLLPLESSSVEQVSREVGALACGRVGQCIWRSDWRQPALDGGGSTVGADHHSR